MSTIVYNKSYKRTVEKPAIPICNIMGVDIAAIDMVWLVDYLNRNVKSLSGDYICVSNVHTTVTAYEKNRAFGRVYTTWTKFLFCIQRMACASFLYGSFIR